jgi:hypothetical protein
MTRETCGDPRWALIAPSTRAARNPSPAQCQTGLADDARWTEARHLRSSASAPETKEDLDRLIHPELRSRPQGQRRRIATGGQLLSVRGGTEHRSSRFEQGWRSGRVCRAARRLHGHDPARSGPGACRTGLGEGPSRSGSGLLTDQASFVGGDMQFTLSDQGWEYVASMR